jgi:hypothetical protein
MKSSLPKRPSVTAFDVIVFGTCVAMPALSRASTSCPL